MLRKYIRRIVEQETKATHEVAVTAAKQVLLLGKEVNLLDQRFEVLARDVLQSDKTSREEWFRRQDEHAKQVESYLSGFNRLLESFLRYRKRTPVVTGAPGAQPPLAETGMGGPHEGS